MNLPKYFVATALLAVMAHTSISIAQVLPPPPPPPPPTDTTLTTTTVTSVVAAPVTTTVVSEPVVTTTVAPAPVATTNETVVADPVAPVIRATPGKGKKNGMDNGKKLGLHKEHNDNRDHDKHAHHRGHDNHANTGYGDDNDDRRGVKDNSKIVLVGTVDGDTFTVTDISSGRLEIGTTLSSNGNKIRVTGFGTGRGGVGTYRVAADN